MTLIRLAFTIVTFFGLTVRAGAQDSPQIKAQKHLGYPLNLPALRQPRTFRVIAVIQYPVLEHLRVGNAKRRRRRQLKRAQNRLRILVFSF
jgi:hypothetical protein